MGLNLQMLLLTCCCWCCSCCCCWQCTDTDHLYDGVTMVCDQPPPRVTLVPRVPTRVTLVSHTGTTHYRVSYLRSLATTRYQHQTSVKMDYHLYTYFPFQCHNNENFSKLLYKMDRVNVNLAILQQ